MIQAAEIIDYEDYGTKIPKGSLSNPYSLEEIIETETGKLINDVTWLANEHRQKEIHRQTETVSDILNSFGVKTKVDTNLTAKGLATGVEVQLTKHRNINILLEQAQLNRREQQNSLGMFLSKWENRNARYLTAAYGERIPAFGDLAGAMKTFSERIRFFAYICDHEWDTDVFCRVFEMPCNEEHTFHLHANIVYQPRQKMSKRKWKAFLQFTNSHFGHGSKDNGVIRDMNEIVKYMLKGEELELLAQENPEALVWLYEQTFNKKIFSAMSEFREFRRDLKQRRLKVITRKGKYVIQKKRSLKGKDDGFSECDITVDEPTGDRTNELVGISNPYFFTSPFKEPVAIIRNLKAFGMSNQPLGTYADLLVDLQPWQDLALEAWERNTDQSPQHAVKYAKMLRETQDVNKVEVLSKHRKKIEAKAQSFANDRYLSKQQKDFAEGKSISVHTSTITVIERDIQRAEKAIIKHQRRVSSVKMLKKLDTGDPPQDFSTRNTSENSYNFLRIFEE